MDECVNEDNFDDCFRYWEIGSFGVWENISIILQTSKTPSSESK